MRINKVSDITNIYNKQMTKATPSHKASLKDQATFSNEAITCQKAYQAALRTEEIRQDKVQHIKEQIRTGNYNVSAREVSEKIVNQLDLLG